MTRESKGIDSQDEKLRPGFTHGERIGAHSESSRHVVIKKNIADIAKTITLALGDGMDVIEYEAHSKPEADQLRSYLPNDYSIISGLHISSQKKRTYFLHISRRPEHA